MTNFEPIKEQIWNAVKVDDRVEFNKQCEALMQKAAMDIWRMGWSLAPKNIDDVFQMLDDLSKWCHERWLEAMECGDAPAEDVSPGDGFQVVKKIIQDSVNGKGNGE